jgi:hypothetical protein
MIHFGSSPAMQQLRGDVGGGGGQMPPGTKPPATWAAGFTSTPREGEFPLGLVWETEESSGWKRIEGDFGKF